MVFRIGTGHGISECQYGANDDPLNPGQGSGQGFGSGPMLWNSTGNVNLSTYERECPGARFLHPAPDRGDDISMHSACFVDDTTLLTNHLGIEHHNRRRQDEGLPTSSSLLECTRNNTQTYSQILWTSGGQLAPPKCNVYLLRPTRWIRDKCTFESNSAFSGSVAVWIDPINPTEIPLNRLEPTEAHRTLGIHIAPGCSARTQTDILSHKLKKWQHGIKHHGLTEKDRWRAYDSCLRPALLYPLLGHSYTSRDLKPVQSALDGTLTNALHLNRHFPRALLNGSTRFAGVNVTTLVHHHWADKVVHFLHHLRQNDTVGKQLHISLSNTQLEVGSAFLFFLLDWLQWGFLTTRTWVTHIWEILDGANLTIDCISGECWLPGPQREQDVFIMDMAIQYYDRDDLRDINWCRRYLQALTLSDLTMGNGQYLHPSYVAGARTSGRKSLLIWPEVPKPPKTAIQTWTSFLLTHVADRFRKLRRRLGSWLSNASPHQETVYFWHLESLFKVTDTGLRRLTPASTRRSRHSKFLDCPLPLEIPPNLIPELWADVQIHHGVIEVLDVSTRRWVPMAEEASSVTPLPNEPFAEYVLRQTSPCEQRLLGQLSFPHQGLDHLADALQHTEVVGVSDGSVIRQMGTHAWTVTTNATNLNRITGPGPVDGPVTSITSYRTELQGQLAVALMTLLLAQYFHIVVDGSLKSVSDNAGALKRLARNWTTTLATHKEPDADLLLFHASLRTRTEAILRYRLDSPVAVPPVAPIPPPQRHLLFTYTWVKGHQDLSKDDSELTQNECLNIQMDALAGQAHDLPAHMRTSQLCSIFPGECWGVFHHQQKITGRLKEALIFAFQETETTSYLTHKYGFTEQVFQSVGWDYFEVLFKKKSPHQRAALSKYIHGWTPTSAFLRRQGREAPACPFCSSTVDERDHVFTCPHTDAVAFRTSAWQKCCTFLLQAARGCPAMVDLLDRKVRGLLRLPLR